MPPLPEFAAGASAAAGVGSLTDAAAAAGEGELLTITRESGLCV